MVLTAVCAVAAWDFRCQYQRGKALDSFHTAFPGGSATTIEPTGLRWLQSRLASSIGVALPNRNIQFLELYPENVPELSPLTPQQVQLLGKLPPVQHVSFSCFELSLDELRIQLCDTSDCSLSLRACRVRRGQLSDLHLPHLKQLSIEFCEVQGLEQIGENFPYLRSFTFEAHLQQRNLNLPSSLQGCRQLVHLSVSGRQLSDQSLVGIESLKNLETLSVWQADNITDAPFSQLNRLKKITSLQFDRTQVGDSTLLHLSKLSKLESLILSDNYRITDRGLSELFGNSSLVELRLDRLANVSAKSIETIQSLAELRELWLRGTRIDTNLAQELRALPKLKTLNLEW